MQHNEKQDQTDMGLYEKLSKLSFMLTRYQQRAGGGFGPMSDPHRGQGRVLALLKMQPEITQRELSYLLDMRPQSLGEFLVKLEKSGYVTRDLSESDRRVMVVRLTEAGRQAAEKRPDESPLFDCLSKEEQEQLSGYLSRILKSFKEKAMAAASDPELEQRRQEWLRHGHPMRQWGGMGDPRSEKLRRAFDSMMHGSKEDADEVGGDKS